MNIKELLTMTNTRIASDLHLICDHAPAIRINGELKQLRSMPQLISTEIESMVFSLLSSSQKDVLIQNRELDFSTVIEIEGSVIRFRGNAYYQRGSLAASFRLIPTTIKSPEELGLPDIVKTFSKLRMGFVLLTGASGQGKSTTLASIIQLINSNRSAHIITVEDPIEHVYPNGQAIISQREMYEDTHSFAKSLRNVLREDPDVVYIGEMRDYETVASALTIAETGHLVFSTLHTNSAAQSIDRIIDMFPASQQPQIRMQLSMVISGIITQRLVPNVIGGRTPVCEILLATPSIKSIIREGKTHLIDNTIQTSRDLGMCLFEDSLREMVASNIISYEIALEYAFRPDRFGQSTGKKTLVT